MRRVQIDLRAQRHQIPADTRVFLDLRHRHIAVHITVDHMHQVGFLKITRVFLAGRFAGARVLEVQGGGVPLAAPLTTQFADRMILVGDAARHVNPITGGGIHTALSGGRIAAAFLAEAIRAGETFTPAVTERYQDAWLEALGEKMWQLYREKSSIFREDDIPSRNARLYATMSGYFSPRSEYKKI